MSNSRKIWSPKRNLLITRVYGITLGMVLGLGPQSAWAGAQDVPLSQRRTNFSGSYASAPAPTNPNWTGPQFIECEHDCLYGRANEIVSLEIANTSAKMNAVKLIHDQWKLGGVDKQRWQDMLKGALKNYGGQSSQSLDEVYVLYLAMQRKFLPEMALALATNNRSAELLVSAQNDAPIVAQYENARALMAKKPQLPQFPTFDELKSAQLHKSAQLQMLAGDAFIADVEKLRPHAPSRTDFLKIDPKTQQVLQKPNGEFDFDDVRYASALKQFKKDQGAIDRTFDRFKNEIATTHPVSKQGKFSWKAPTVSEEDSAAVNAFKWARDSVVTQTNEQIREKGIFVPAALVRKPLAPLNRPAALNKTNTSDQKNPAPEKTVGLDGSRTAFIDGHSSAAGDLRSPAGQRGKDIEFGNAKVAEAPAGAHISLKISYKAQAVDEEARKADDLVEEAINAFGSSH